MSQILAEIRTSLTTAIWDSYIRDFPHLKNILSEQKLILDHFAIIDLPSQNSGCHYMARVLERIGYIRAGAGYLKSKINDFIWFRQEDYHNKTSYDMLPQIIIGDFRIEELSANVANIIKKYTSDIKLFDFDKFDVLLTELPRMPSYAKTEILKLLTDYFISRRWKLPSLQEFEEVKKENELLAWVLLFGSKINHFGIGVYLRDDIINLEAFNGRLEKELKIKINSSGGKIKGNPAIGIEQSATLGQDYHIRLSDGSITHPGNFMEFIWRYSDKSTPKLWTDYHTDFIPQNANHVVESVYKKQAA